MRYCLRFTVFFVMLCLSLCLVSCEKKKLEGKVVVSAQEFTLRQDKENTFTIDAKGKIKNVGEVDVKKVVVTGYCRSCGEIWAPGRWFISGAEKMPYQKDIINYLPVGAEESFSFGGVADIILSAGQGAPEKPEKFEIVIESFETVEE